jgi:hypothetical protein
MAGRRQESGKPLRRVMSAEKRRARLDAELAGLTDPRDRVNAAADYVRAALAQRPGSERDAEAVVDDLISAGDRILGLKGGAA